MFPVPPFHHTCRPLSKVKKESKIKTWKIIDQTLESEYQPPEHEEMERKMRAGDTLLGKESDEEEMDSESEDDDDEDDLEGKEQPAAKKSKKELPNAPRAVKEAKRDKKEQPAIEIADAERNLAKKAIVNKKRKRLLERIEKARI